jgi:hypothetical protein
MRNALISLALGLFIGGVGGFGVAIFVYPFIFPPPEAMEAAPSASGRTLVATGEFIHADPSDPIHHGKGKVTVYDDVVHLGPNFEVGPGPKFHVYLVPEANVTPSTAVARTMYVDLGRLRAFKGSQNYKVPAGLDLKKYKSAVIWCEQFGVLISPAKLKPAN